jgi:hypothetical protein
MEPVPSHNRPRSLGASLDAEASSKAVISAQLTGDEALGRLANISSNGRR